MFASASGDLVITDYMCAALASDPRSISPTRFHNSVHNAPAGYWGIATGAMRPSDTVAAFDASFAAGLLEAAARIATDPASALLLVSYDAPYPEPLRQVRPIADVFGVGLVLDGGTSGPRAEMRLADERATAMDDPALEALRRGIPAARSLPLMRAIARGSAETVAIEYLDGRSLVVDFTP